MSIEALIEALEEIYPDSITGLSTEEDLIIRKAELDIINHIKSLAGIRIDNGN